MMTTRQEVSTENARSVRDTSTSSRRPGAVAEDGVVMEDEDEDREAGEEAGGGRRPLSCRYTRTGVGEGGGEGERERGTGTASRPPRPCTTDRTAASNALERGCALSSLTITTSPCRRSPPGPKRGRSSRTRIDTKSWYAVAVASYRCARSPRHPTSPPPCTIPYHSIHISRDGCVWCFIPPLVGRRRPRDAGI